MYLSRVTPIRSVNSDNVIGFVSSPTQLFLFFSFLASITVHLGVQNPT